MSIHFGHTAVAKTRKDHLCFWCGELIATGSNAFKSAWIWDGDFAHGYDHPECKKAYQDSDGSELEEGFYQGDFKRGIPALKEDGK